MTRKASCVIPGAVEESEPKVLKAVCSPPKQHRLHMANIWNGSDPFDSPPFGGSLRVTQKEATAPPCGRFCLKYRGVSPLCHPELAEGSLYTYRPRVIPSAVEGSLYTYRPRVIPSAVEGSLYTYRPRVIPSAVEGSEPKALKAVCSPLKQHRLHMANIWNGSDPFDSSPFLLGGSLRVTQKGATAPPCGRLRSG